MIITDWNYHLDTDGVIKGQNADPEVIRKRSPRLVGIAERALAEAKEIIKYLCTLVPDADVKMMHAITNTEKYGLWDRMRLKQARGEAEETED